MRPLIILVPKLQPIGNYWEPPGVSSIKSTSPGTKHYIQETFKMYISNRVYGKKVSGMGFNSGRCIVQDVPKGVHK